ncbi:NCS1 nucleoside transporter family [Auricularia subglabra TFB-10046 SS5]|nr:NCS1 nucleoside transporter family [Auricularia subglabra TFB-10046 SS5]
MSKVVRRAVKAIEVPHAPGLSFSELMLQNDDLLPVPPHQRTWKWWNYLTFWLADSFNVNTWYISSSMITAGLTWWEAWIAVWIGYAIAAVFLVLNAYAGAKLHLVFPVNIRYTFGIYGGLWPTFNRAAMACVWYGVQAWIGGQCVYLLLQAIWPSTARIPNGIPSSGTDTAHFLGFFLFSLASLIPVYYPLHKIRHLFTVKAIVTPIAGVAFFIWFIVKAGGVGPIVKQPASIHGSARAWAFVNALMSCISNMATLITNAQDFASRADKTSSIIWPQLFALPFTFAMVSFLGIIVSSSSTVIYGEAIWNPLDLLGRVLDDSPSHGSRAGVAFIAIAFIIAQIGTNISANSISAGCDLTALFPRFITIRRGGYIAATVGFAMLPWRLLSSSNNFATYLSAYSVFLSSIIGCMLAQYYVVSRRLVKVRDLYTVDREGLYYFTGGVNWRAYAAYLCGIAINIVGFVGAIGRTVPLAAQRIYQLSFFTGLGVSFIVYVLLNRLWPTRQATAEEAEEIFEPWNEETKSTSDSASAVVGADMESESRRSTEKEKIAV